MGSFLLALMALALLSVLLGAALAWLADPRQASNTSNQNNNVLDSDSALERSVTDADTHFNDAIIETNIEQLIEQVNIKLPQTQCAQCGYPGCRPYATAIVIDDVPINQCPPGGASLIAELADYLGKQIIPLDSERGVSKPPQVAYIDEAACIGCTLCIAACPVDAIVGASRFMHTVISDQCTGCELCLPPCPVDCIELLPVAVPLSLWRWPNPA